MSAAVASCSVGTSPSFFYALAAGSRSPSRRIDKVTGPEPCNLPLLVSSEYLGAGHEPQQVNRCELFQEVPDRLFSTLQAAKNLAVKPPFQSAGGVLTASPQCPIVRYWGSGQEYVFLVCYPVPQTAARKKLASDKPVLAIGCDLTLPMSLQKKLGAAIDFLDFFYCTNSTSVCCQRWSVRCQH